MGSSRLFCEIETQVVRCSPLLFITFDGHGSQSLIGPEIQDESHALRYFLLTLSHIFLFVGNRSNGSLQGRGCQVGNRSFLNPLLFTADTPLFRVLCKECWLMCLWLLWSREEEEGLEAYVRHPTPSSQGSANVTNERKKKDKPCVQNRKELIFSHGKAKGRYRRANTHNTKGEREEKERRKRVGSSSLGMKEERRRRGEERDHGCTRAVF